MISGELMRREKMLEVWIPASAGMTVIFKISRR